MPLQIKKVFPNTGFHSFRHTLQLILCILIAFSSFAPANGYGLAESLCRQAERQLGKQA